MTDPDLDVVVFGATSFVGKILCQYLVEQFGVGGGLRWAAAGRSKVKLEGLRESLGDAATDLKLLIADAADADALRRMCAQTRVVSSTVGPYALYGEPLLRVCAETGTDYCDLTAEVQWIRRMIRSHERRAAESGARIVHCCGFDSIPSDLGVFCLQQQALERFGQPCVNIKMRVKAMRGGVSGGTVASMLNLFQEVAASPPLRRELADPYSLCPAGHSFMARQHNVKFAEYDADFEAWAAPFIMAAVNTRIVHRSNALSDNAYGDTFRYQEAMLTGRGVKGKAMAFGASAGLAGFLLAAAFRPSR
ncbi:MAG: saccharopine dehydrogenase NADP-binding domain-containing protein, partial [Gammaproteobacteria bacterium]|nr:saccharopine dehydrogenase NADP-binding domain-containing protein [Gammaproteobacteria bacterium]